MSGLVDKSRKIRLGFAGCGKAFERLYLPSLVESAEWEVVAFCDTSKERRTYVSSVFPGSPVFESMDEMIDESLLDAIIIATPPETHCELTIKAIKRGLNVLVEKPMALTLEEAIAMVESSRCAGRHLNVGFNRRFRRPYRQLKGKLAGIPSNRIQLFTFEFIFSLSGWNAVTAYLGDESRGGGVLEDVASHLVDLLPWVIGEKISRVKAEPFSLKEGTDKRITMEICFENGIVAKGIVGHGERFSEWVEIQTDSRKFIVYPAGLMDTSWMPELLLSPYCSFRSYIHFALHKLSGAKNLSQESVAKQLLEFAKAQRGEHHARSIADGLSGINALEVTKALSESIGSGGIWITITEPGGNRP